METVILFIFGTAIGSFLNVVIDRLPRDESLMGRSHCDACKKTLMWYDMIPIISFILLKRSCRFCSKKLSWQYPLIELVTGLLFIFSWKHIPYPANTQLIQMHPEMFLYKIAYLGIVSGFFAIFVADAKYHIIPDQLSAFLLLLGIVVMPMAGFIPQVFFQKVIAAFVIAAPIYFLHWITKGNGMGFGDVKLSFVIGFMLGIRGGIIALYVAFIAGALFGIIMMIFQKRGFKSKIAFGPFLVIGIMATMLFGHNIAAVIHSIYGI